MTTKSLKWHLVLTLASFGLLMGLFSVEGFIQRWEPLLWLILAFTVALILSKNIRSNLFLHGVVIGLLWSLANAATQTTFFDHYLINNPVVRKEFAEITFMDPRFVILLSAPLYGLIIGALIGGLAILFKKVFPGTRYLN